MRSEETHDVLDEYDDRRDEDLFWETIRPDSEPLGTPWFRWGVAAVLVLSVPWYLPRGFADRIFGGLPFWTWVTFCFSVLLALLTSLAAMRLWRDADDPRDVSPDPPQGGEERGES